eukprot:sb/3471988/
MVYDKEGDMAGEMAGEMESTVGQENLVFNDDEEGDNIPLKDTFKDLKVDQVETSLGDHEGGSVIDLPELPSRRRHSSRRKKPGAAPSSGAVEHPEDGIEMADLERNDVSRRSLRQTLRSRRSVKRATGAGAAAPFELASIEDRKTMRRQELTRDMYGSTVGPLFNGPLFSGTSI